MIKNYLWDFDGMLFDSYPHITSAFLKALSDFDISADYDEAKAKLEISYATAYAFYSADEKIRERHRLYEHDYMLRPRAVPFENTLRTLEKIVESGGKNYLYTHRGNESTYHYLREYDMERLFAGGVDSSMNFPAKPAPDAIEWICENYGLDKAKTIMVGDREIDVLAGKNAGVYSCRFTKEKNIVTAADFVVGDISEVLEIRI